MLRDAVKSAAAQAVRLDAGIVGNESLGMVEKDEELLVFPDAFADAVANGMSRERKPPGAALKDAASQLGAPLKNQVRGLMRARERPAHRIPRGRCMATLEAVRSALAADASAGIVEQPSPLPDPWFSDGGSDPWAGAIVQPHRRMAWRPTAKELWASWRTVAVEDVDAQMRLKEYGANEKDESNTKQKEPEEYETHFAADPGAKESASQVDEKGESEAMKKELETGQSIQDVVDNTKAEAEVASKKVASTTAKGWEEDSMQDHVHERWKTVVRRRRKNAYELGAIVVKVTDMNEEEEGPSDILARALAAIQKSNKELTDSSNF